MKLEDFTYLLELFKKTSDEFSELHDIGFDFFEGKYKLSDSFYFMLIKTLSLFYTKDGIEWIEWFMLEADYGTNDLKAKDENGNPICYSIESLYNHVEQNHKL
jgi:hypothetical protein